MEIILIISDTVDMDWESDIQMKVSNSCIHSMNWSGRNCNISVAMGIPSPTDQAGMHSTLPFRSAIPIKLCPFPLPSRLQVTFSV